MAVQCGGLVAGCRPGGWRTGLGCYRQTSTSGYNALPAPQTTQLPATGEKRAENVLQVLSRREPNPKGQGQVEADSSQNKL